MLVTNRRLHSRHHVPKSSDCVGAGVCETHLRGLIPEKGQEHRQDVSHRVFLAKLRRKLHARVREGHSHILQKNM